MFQVSFIFILNKNAERARQTVIILFSRLRFPFCKCDPRVEAELTSRYPVPDRKATSFLNRTNALGRLRSSSRCLTTQKSHRLVFHLKRTPPFHSRTPPQLQVAALPPTLPLPPTLLPSFRRPAEAMRTHLLHRLPAIPGRASAVTPEGVLGVALVVLVVLAGVRGAGRV